jgi:integral membrane sensor domain MASE1
MVMEPATLTLIFGILIGFWLGTGIAPALLVWIKNPEESSSWKIWASSYSLIEGPIGLVNIKHLLNKVDGNSA